MTMSKMYSQLKVIAQELEKNGKNYSRDQQAHLRMAAQSIIATVYANDSSRRYSYDEDD